MNGSIVLSDDSEYEASNIRFSETRIGDKSMRTVTFSTTGGNQMLIFQDRSPILKQGIHKYRLVSQNRNSQNVSSILGDSNVTMFVKVELVDVEALAARLVCILEETQGSGISEKDETWRNLLGLAVEEHEAFERAIRRLKDQGIINITYRDSAEVTKIVLR